MQMWRTAATSFGQSQQSVFCVFGQKQSILLSGFVFGVLKHDNHVFVSLRWGIPIVTAVNTWHILLLRVSMRMFPFGINFWTQSHTGCSLPSHVDFPDNIALWRQTWARPSFFSSLRAWKLGKSPSSLNLGPCGAELHSQTRAERSVSAGDALMNWAAPSQTKPTFLQLLSSQHPQICFPSHWFKLVLQRQTQFWFDCHDLVCFSFWSSCKEDQNDLSSTSQSQLLSWITKRDTFYVYQELSLSIKKIEQTPLLT